MIKKVIVLGAGVGQLPLLEALKRQMFYTIVIAPQRANSPCFAIADRYYFGDVRNKELILDIATKEGVVAVLSDQLDVAIQSCGYVTEKLKLIGNSYHTSKLFSDKQLMHKYASQNGIKVARNLKTNTVLEAKDFANTIGYPMIIKPIDSDGSRGVHKLHSDSELFEHFDATKQFSSDGCVYVEEFINGQEYVVDGFAWNGNYKTLAIGKCYNFNIYGKCISKQRIFKSAASELTDIESRIIKINHDIVKLFSPNIASTQGEYIYDETKDEVYFNEIAARGGGCFVSSHLVPYACGINVNDVLAKCIAGTFKQPTLNLSSGYSAYTCFLLSPGIVTSINGINTIKQLSTIKDMFISNIYEGMETTAIKDKSSRYGPFITASSDLEKMNKDILFLKNNFKPHKR